MNAFVKKLITKDRILKTLNYSMFESFLLNKTSNISTSAAKDFDMNDSRIVEISKIYSSVIRPVLDKHISGIAAECEKYLGSSNLLTKTLNDIKKDSSFSNGKKLFETILSGNSSINLFEGVSKENKIKAIHSLYDFTIAVIKDLDPQTVKDIVNIIL